MFYEINFYKVFKKYSRLILGGHSWKEDIFNFFLKALIALIYTNIVCVEDCWTRISPEVTGKSSMNCTKSIFGRQNSSNSGTCLNPRTGHLDLKTAVWTRLWSPSRSNTYQIQRMFQLQISKTKKLTMKMHLYCKLSLFCPNPT